MKQRTISRIACLLAASATLLVSGASQASPEFPGEIARLLGMACPPPCTLCHATPQGGGAPDKAWAGPLILQGGLKPGDLTSLANALGYVDAAMPPIDTDMDGTADVAELRLQRDPSINPTTSMTSDEILCPPQYGCGARVASRPPVDGSALGFALVVAGYLALRSRRK
jgi:hypothetical protein